MRLHEGMTPKITHRVRQCALNLQDQKFIAMISSRDLAAQEAEYNAKWLVKSYNASNREKKEGKMENAEQVSQGIALVELMDT